MKYPGYTIPAIFIAFDILTGIIRAVYEGKLASKSMRKGLFNKMGEVLTLSLAKLLEYTSVNFDLGFSIPLYNGTVIYVIVMELLSIVENISALNPDMRDYLSKFMKRSDWKE